MFSKILRRTHMYLALFLTPWVLMYTLSTFVMNHRHELEGVLGKGQPAWEKERETRYDGAFPPGADPKSIAPAILASLGMEGAHTVAKPADDGSIAIVRQFAVRERRVTFRPATGAVTIERRAFRPNFVLERFHRRRGYDRGYAADNAWAFSVDLVVAAILFWALSGLWLWWELKITRTLGGIALFGGIAVFAMFLRTT